MSLAPTVGAPVLARAPEPFVGPVPLGEDEAPFFHGRAAEAAAVAEKLRTARLTVLYGPSGVGKTSLLRAGVVPLLREEALQVEDEPPFAVCVATVENVHEAARAALQEIAGEEPLPPARGGLTSTLRMWTERTGTLLLVLDRFEEHLLGHDGTELAGFDAELARIVADGSLRVHVLLSIREDAWGKLDRFDGHIPVRLVNYVRLEHLGLDTAREAIEGPVWAWNRTRIPGSPPYYVEGGLIDAVVAGARNGDGVEAAFLQLALQAVWHATVDVGEQVLTLARLESLGGMEVILDRHVSSALRRLTPREQAIASDCFRFLVTAASTRVAHPAADLAEWIRRPADDVAEVLDELCTGEGGRLVRAVVPTPARAALRYELYHDELAEPVLAWRAGHERRRRAVSRRRFVLLGRGAAVVVAVLAAFTAWAVVGRERANRLYHSERDTNRALQAQVLRLTAKQREEAAQRVVVRRLQRQNTSLGTRTARLHATRATLDRRIAALQAENGKLVSAIDRFNTWNGALATRITDLDKSYAGQADDLRDLREQRRLLQDEVGTLASEAAFRTSELAALRAANAALAQKADRLGFALPPAADAPAAQPASPTASATTKAATFAAPAAVAARDPFRHRVDVLERNLAALLRRGSPPVGQVAFLRKANALLARQRDALAGENRRLEQTRTAVEARKGQLEQMRTQAAAEHRRLAAAAAAREGRNAKRTKEIAEQTSVNARLQATTAKRVAALGETQRQIARLRDDNAKLVAFLDPSASRLARASQGEEEALAALLALEAYRLTPFDADDPAHPEAYNALLLSLRQLDEPAATKLVSGKSGKVGTTRSELLADALCGRVKRGLTRAEWNRFLPGVGYTASAARPCP